jgi:hypothetical protein
VSPPVLDPVILSLSPHHEGARDGGGGGEVQREMGGKMVGERVFCKVGGGELDYGQT